MELECLKELLKREPIVKIVNELPDKNTADLNYIYIIPKEGEGKDKKAYVLRPDRSGFDTIDLTPQLVNVVGEGYITVEKESLNENGDVTFTVTTSPSFQAVLDSLTAKGNELDTKVSSLEAKDSEQDTKLVGHDTEISNLKAKDAEVDTALGTLGTAVGKVTELVENKAQGLDTRVTALEAKEDLDKQTLAVSGNKLSISNGNEVDLPQYDDSAVKESIKQANDYTEQVKNYLEGKVNANKDAIDANKADADAKNNALTTRVNVLEEAKPVVENKLTEIEAKNTAQDEKITALENRTDNFINNVTVSKADGKVKLTYSRVDGSSSEVEFEDSDTVTLAYDDEPLKTRIKALEDKEDKDTIYNDTEVKQGIKANENAIQGVESDLTALRTHTDARIEALENKEDKDTIYDDSAVRGQITALESKVDGNKNTQDGKNTELENRIQALEVKPDKDTVYDDSALTNRVQALENKEDKDTVYDDSALKAKVSDLTDKDTALDARISALEAKPDKDTVYDDTDVKARISALETKPDKDTVYDDSEIKGKVATLEAKDTSLESRIQALEDKPDNDTVYNDTELRTSLGALSDKVTQGDTKQEAKNAELAKTIADNKSDADTRLQALEDKEDSDKQALSLTDHTLSISNGNSVELPKYDDTEVKAKNTEQDEEIKALKEKTKSFLTGASVTRQDNVVTLTYTNIDGSSTNLEFNDNDTKALAYDDTALKARVQDLENRADNDTIYNDAPIKERLNALETKVDKDTVYDDAPIKERITALENKADKDTVYDDSAVTARLTSLETKEDKDTHYNVKSTTDGVTVVKSQENGEEVFTINADLAFKNHYTKGEVDKAIADNNKRTQKLVKYTATWKNPEYFKYTNDGRVPVLSHNNITSFGNMKLDGIILKPMSANTIICEFPPNTPKPIEFIEVQAYIGNEPISMWYSDRTVRVTDVPQSLVGKRIIFNFAGLFA